jgi:hypothetical protein
VFASGPAREKDGEEKSEYGSDQCFPDRVVVKLPGSSPGDQKPQYAIPTVQRIMRRLLMGRHLSISKCCHTLSLRAEDF